MIALPIPDKKSPIRYSDLVWRGRNLGTLVEALTNERQRRNFGAHVDPDLRQDLLPRRSGWRATLGQCGSAQGHLRNQGVGAGDVFLFWGLFQRVDDAFRWVGRPEHRIWGWIQVADVVSVDDVVRRGGDEWRWTRGHPHLEYASDHSNTLYIASQSLSLPGVPKGRCRGHGTYDTASPERCLTAPGAESPLEWSLPLAFFPRERPPLTHHARKDRWSLFGQRAILRAVSRGQEFVLDLDAYPEVAEWVADVILKGADAAA